MTQRRSALLSLLALAVAGPGCVVSIAGLADLKATREMKSAVVAPNLTELVVDSHHGAIVVEPGLEGAVTVVGTARATSDEELDKIQMNAEVKDGVVSVGWETSDKKYDRRDLSLKIKAPKGVALKLKTGAGAIHASGTTKGLVAETGAGEIAVKDVVGDLKLKTGAGSIDAAGIDGPVRAETQAGSVEVSGRIQGDSLAESGAGSITATLPADANLKITASSAAGSLDNDFGLAKPKGVGGTMSGSLGDGVAGSLRLRTSAGSVHVRKAK